jgi:hypothetical protein
VKAAAALTFLALSLSARAVFAVDAALPGAGFNGDRYETLWTKSPFAIATPEAGATSTDYQLVGMAQFDGVSYASLIDQQTSEHFVLTSEKPVKNLTLVALHHDANGASAVIERQGERLVLHEDNAAPPPAPAAAPMATVPMIAMPPGFPGGIRNSPVGGVVMAPPQAHTHRPLIVVSPPPQNPQ